MMANQSGRVIVWGEQISGKLLFTELCVFDAYPGEVAILEDKDGNQTKIELPKEIHNSDFAGKILHQSFAISES